VAHPSGPRLSAIVYDVVHVNSEFVDQASDHDPRAVAKLDLRG
jgi:hypothetical protein